MQCPSRVGFAVRGYCSVVGGEDVSLARNNTCGRDERGLRAWLGAFVDEKEIQEEEEAGEHDSRILKLPRLDNRDPGLQLKVEYKVGQPQIVSSQPTQPRQRDCTFSSSQVSGSTSCIREIGQLNPRTISNLIVAFL
uniref:Predicted protein n=1 Tax=Physcomitrium patens TaxID=3218 RepID=A9U630_PHYPA